MGKYIIKRLLQAIPVLFGITVITFFVTHLAPGGPMAGMVKPGLSVEDLIAAEEALGLHEPIVVQYFNWLGEAIHGNWGYSIKTSQQVMDMILERLPATLLLTGTGFVFSMLLGVLLGIITGTRKGSRLDSFLSVLAFIGISVPSFFLALGVVYVFALKLGWFPTGAMQTIGANYTGFRQVVDVAWHLVLPVTTLAILNSASTMRFTRSSILDVVHEDYIRTAKAKGVRRRAVIYVHTLKNALIPVITLFGLSLPSLFSGSYIIESIFNWPGLGTLSVQSITARDYPVMMGLNLITAVLVLCGNLIADLLYAAVDPRVLY